MHKRQLYAALLAAALLSTALPSALAVDAAPAQGSAASAASVAEGRQSDLDLLLSTLQSAHPNLYSVHTQAEFDAKCAEIQAGLATMSDFDFAIALSELTALIGDSHTGANFGNFIDQLHFLPMYLTPMADGLVITGLPSGNEKFLGGVLTAVNGVSLDQLEDRISPMLGADNPTRRRYDFYNIFYVYEILQHYGITDQPEGIRLTVQTTADGTQELTLDALDSNQMQSLDYISLEQESTPVTAARSQLYFMEPLDEHTLYIQYNSCQEDPNLPMEDFTEQVRQSIEQNGYDRVMLDLRNNGGGSDGVLLPLLYLLDEKHEQDGVALYTLIGDRTFSSALINAVELKQIGATLVGTPTGGSVDHFGEVSSVTLSYSGITVQYSTNYFDLSTLLDAAVPYDTEALPPDIHVQQSLTDYLAGRDTAVQAILARAGDANQPKTELTRGALAAALGRAYAAEMGEGISFAQPLFADVSIFDYAAPYIAWAQANGLMCGDSADTFAPDRAVTREELAAVLTRYAAFRGKSLAGTPATPADAAAISPWALDAVCALSGAGVLELQDGDFAPKSQVLRAEWPAILTAFHAALV